MSKKVNNQDATEEAPQHPEYDLYKVYLEYFENQQKVSFDFWSKIIKNFWWYKQDKKGDE